MIGQAFDTVVSWFSPTAGLRRKQARKILRSYSGAEANRLTNHSKPQNRSANSEMAGPFGADSLRAWSRKLVRDNAYAWGVVDTIVSSVVENGITAQSVYETDEGLDQEELNWSRDAVWQEWCEVADYNGEYTFAEIQRMAQREMVEAGEVLIHLVKLPSNKANGIHRPVPFALELIEADRLATDYDVYKVRGQGAGTNRIVRGVELDDKGRSVAYWVYESHPSDVNQPLADKPIRLLAADVLHLFRRERIGQSRGVPWFAPVAGWLRDLGIYVDNEIQTSAVAACFGVAIKTSGGVTGLNGPTDSDSSDTNGNTLEYLEPAMVARLRKDEEIEVINPARPNSSADPWIKLMLRGIAVGTGLSYEVVARDYSQTSYSSSRTSQLEDRRRFRCWQNYLVNHLCQPVWDRFCETAAIQGVRDFPSSAELLADRRKCTAVEWQTPEWEWVDPTSEQQASQNSIDALQSTYATELGSRGRNWKSVFYQRAKEEKLRRRLGLVTSEQAQLAAQVETSEQNTGAGIDVGTGEMRDSSRLQFTRNQKAIHDILTAFSAQDMTRAKARVMLDMLGISDRNIEALLDDAEGAQELPGVPEPAEVVTDG